MQRWNELVLDTATAILYVLGSYSVYNREKEFTSPVRQPRLEACAYGAPVHR
jgi:hypothetical protein